MVAKVIAVLVSASVWGTMLVDAEAGLERAEDHHEHGTPLDAPDGGSHQHGDEDDHHESPDSPCDHHVLHCCCSHVHVMAAGPLESSDRIELSQSFHSPAETRDLLPSIDRILHIPIA